MRQNSEQQQEESYCPWTSRVLPAVQQHSLPPHAVPSAHRAMCRMSNRLAPLPPWNSLEPPVPPWNLAGHRDFYLIKEGINPG